MTESPQPSLGWLELSEQSLARLQRELQDSEQGVVDEMGMLTIHGAYADRFFPGLSVLQTRARYLLFVPWNFLHAKGAPNLGDEMKRLNLWLAETLANTMPGERGIIGRTLLPYRRVPSQPPDFIYWTALSEFGMYRGPSRRRLFAAWSRLRIQEAQGIDGGALPVEDIVDFDAPRPPPHWGRLRKLSFDVSRDEAQFLIERLATTDSLLGDLAKQLESKGRLSSTGGPWDDPLVELIARNRGEWPHLERARDASALAQVVRGVYGTLVEQRRNRERNSTGAHYRVGLDQLCFKGGEPSEVLKRARRVDPDALLRDAAAPTLKELVLCVVAECTALRNSEQLSTGLLGENSEAVFRRVEVRRKGLRRARLAENAHGEQLRGDFGDTTVRVYGLDYRWVQARQMLNDIADGLQR